MRPQSSSRELKALAVELVEPATANAGPEVALLAGLLGKAIVRSTRVEAISSGVDWDAFVHIAQENRILLMAARQLHEIGLSAPEHAQKTIERYRALTLSLNGANLVMLRTLIEAFAAARIDVINLKGPVALSVLHGDSFIRPSSDIDLLVHRRDFDRAGEVIAAMGFTTPRGADTFWWREFLGEQHYYQTGKPPVDLHHRIQQPGSPAPRSLQPFWASRIESSVGKLKVPVLAPTHACLLSCVSLAKAIANREPAGAHAFDIAAYLASCPTLEIQTLADVARRLGLMNTLCLGAWTVRALFGVSIVGLPLERAMAFASERDLATMVLAPDAAVRVASHRTRLLMSLADGPGDLARELAWSIAARYARITTTPRREKVDRGWADQLGAKR